MLNELKPIEPPASRAPRDRGLGIAIIAIIVSVAGLIIVAAVVGSLGASGY